MSKTLWTSAVAIGLAVGAAGVPTSAFAGGRSASSTSIGVSSYGGHGGYSTSVGYGYSHRSGNWGRGWGRGYSHSYRGYNRHYHHGHHGTGDALLGFMIGAFAIGAIAASQDHDSGSSYSGSSYYDPPPAQSYSYAPQAAQGCHVVNRIGPDSSGQTVKFAATMCYDRSGTPYIAPGSQHIIER
jgi:hypothetical protein